MSSASRGSLHQQIDTNRHRPIGNEADRLMKRDTIKLEIKHSLTNESAGDDNRHKRVAGALAED